MVHDLRQVGKKFSTILLNIFILFYESSLQTKCNHWKKSVSQPCLQMFLEKDLKELIMKLRSLNALGTLKIFPFVLKCITCLSDISTTASSISRDVILLRSKTVETVSFPVHAPLSLYINHPIPINENWSFSQIIVWVWLRTLSVLVVFHWGQANNLLHNSHISVDIS